MSNPIRVLSIRLALRRYGILCGLWGDIYLYVPNTIRLTAMIAPYSRVDGPVTSGGGPLFDDLGLDAVEEVDCS